MIERVVMEDCKLVIVTYVSDYRWVFSSNSISDLIKKNLDPVLNDVKPAFLGEL